MALFRTFEEAAEAIYPPDRRPRVRTLRERMAAVQCVVYDGRECYTTDALIDKFKAHLCKATVPSLNQLSGARKRRKAPSKRTGWREASFQFEDETALSPEDELSAALEATRLRKGKPKSINSTKLLKIAHRTSP